MLVVLVDAKVAGASDHRLQMAQERIHLRRLAELVSLIGLACVALSASPPAANASLRATYSCDPQCLLRVTGDESADEIHVRCESGKVNVDGHTLFDGALNCSERFHTQLDGMGGDDDINTSQMTAADFSSFGGLEAFGGPGHDTITGGALDEILGFPGDLGADTIHGGPGDDQIGGTLEGDLLYGDAGEDQFNPHGGPDVVYGGPDHDAIDDGALKDRDRFYGEGGPDQIFGGGGADLLDGGPGKDYIDGQAGKDRILGRAGGDSIFGGGLGDFLFGQAGNDFIRGGAGNDLIRGGAGKDNVRQ